MKGISSIECVASRGNLCFRVGYDAVIKEANVCTDVERAPRKQTVAKLTLEDGKRGVRDHKKTTGDRREYNFYFKEDMREQNFKNK